jgi:hypothetical protein
MNKMFNHGCCLVIGQVTLVLNFFRNSCALQCRSKARPLEVISLLDLKSRPERFKVETCNF